MRKPGGAVFRPRSFGAWAKNNFRTPLSKGILYQFHLIICHRICGKWTFPVFLPGSLFIGTGITLQYNTLWIIRKYFSEKQLLSQAAFIYHQQIGKFPEECRNCIFAWGNRGCGGAKIQFLHSGTVLKPQGRRLRVLTVSGSLSGESGTADFITI